MASDPSISFPKAADKKKEPASVSSFCGKSGFHRGRARWCVVLAGALGSIPARKNALTALHVVPDQNGLERSNRISLSGSIAWCLRGCAAVQDIADWLDKLGMAEYAQRFAENRIDFSVLPDLTDQDLEKMGVVLGDRRKILRAITGLMTPRKPLKNLATRWRLPQP